MEKRRNISAWINFTNWNNDEESSLDEYIWEKNEKMYEREVL